MRQHQRHKGDFSGYVGLRRFILQPLKEFRIRRLYGMPKLFDLLKIHATKIGERLFY